MYYAIIPYVIIPYVMFGTGTIFTCLFLYALFKQRNRLASLFSLICLSMAIYIFAYAMELLSADLAQIKYYMTLQYYGFSFLPLLWLVFAYKFYFKKELSLRVGLPLAIIPFLTMFFVSTNDYHSLYYKSISAMTVDGIVLVTVSKGIWHMLFSIYSYLLMLAGSYIFFVAWKGAKFQFKTQNFWMFLGSVFPLIASALYLFMSSSSVIDLIPVSFLLLALTYFVVLFKYDFLELKEIVRGYAFGQINEGIFFIDEQSRVIDFNHAGELTFDWLRADNIGKSLSAFEDGRKILNSTGSFFEVEIEKNGELKSYEFRVTMLRERGAVVGKIFLFQDITEQKLAIERLNYIATHDMLSDIYNRARVMEEVEALMSAIRRSGGKISVLMLDIDHFKNINDRYGHMVGDLVIKNVAQQCKSLIRKGDSVGRYGGEEFIVVLYDTDKKNAIKIAEKIRKHIAALPLELEGHSISITVSIGVATVSARDRSISAQDIVNNADMALYIAKNSGRNAVKSL